ncbi:MAG TPA: ATP-binding protein [Candidatus Eremiobacteraceae bacterium]|nr:ATP-binding protein [Candidatus Eremiobacteraceae bacterium]
MPQAKLMLKVDLRSDPSLLAVVRGMTEQMCEVLGFSAAECRSVTRAVDEALSNIIRHAYKGARERTIQLSLSQIRTRRNGHARQGLEILLEDTGPAVDPTKLCPRDLDEVRPGGLGLHFIRQSMDKIQYQRSGRVNRLWLSKYLPAPNTPQDS